MWTTIAHDSTASHPKLTASPAYVAAKWSTTMAACPDIGTAYIIDENSQPITVEAINAKNFPALDTLAAAEVPEPAVPEGTNTTAITADVVALSNKVDEVCACAASASLSLPCHSRGSCSFSPALPHPCFLLFPFPLSVPL